MNAIKYGLRLGVGVAIGAFAIDVVRDIIDDRGTIGRAVRTAVRRAKEGVKDEIESVRLRHLDESD